MDLSLFSFEGITLQSQEKRHFPSTERKNAVEASEMNCEHRPVERIHFLLSEVMYLAAF